MRNPETVSGSAPLFVSVTVWGGLVTPTLWPGKSTLAAERAATGAWPVPLSETACGLPAALSAIVSEPTRVLLPVGVKVTLIVQLAPAAIVFGATGQLFVCAKSPSVATELMTSGPVPEFVTVMARGALVVFTA